MHSSLYTRPDKPKTMRLTKREVAPQTALPCVKNIIEVDRHTECHVTPIEVARRMVDYLGSARDYLTLEPQAGTGNVIQTLFDSGYLHTHLVAIERNVGLCDVINQRFNAKQPLNLINHCFLEYAKNTQGKISYPRIIMNPPFSIC